MAEDCRGHFLVTKIKMKEETVDGFGEKKISKGHPIGIGINMNSQ